MAKAVTSRGRNEWQGDSYEIRMVDRGFLERFSSPFVVVVAMGGCLVPRI